MLKFFTKKIKKIFKNKLPIINVGSGESLTIMKLSRIIAKELKYNGKIVFDKNFQMEPIKKILIQKKYSNWAGNHVLV